MMADLGSVARQLIPPVLWNLLVKLKHTGEAPAWEYLSQGWAYTGRHEGRSGWNDPSILDIYRRKWPKF
jgi:hypothetical protein